MASMLFSTRFLRRLVPLAGALSLACVGCAETTSGDLAMMEIQKLRAEARANEMRLAAIEGRQMYVAQQLSVLAGVIGEVGREAGARAESTARRQDELARHVAQVEQETIAERERARAAAEAPQSIAARAQAMIDGGQIKATVKNGKTKLEVVGGASASAPTAPSPPSRRLELEDPWAAQRKPTAPASPPVKPPGRRMSDDLGF
ncbi:hypothetical protein [Polyangium spumosum]|uniref:hypothetical protein n=1 Tax=Polyangium spumosum TaxID=889282 RepID=UPI0014790AB2|nr:hypothetical protein [Polyangium spumosum]